MSFLSPSDPRFLERTARDATLLAPAKVNLTLRILARLENGYHLLWSLISPLSLSDRVQVSITGSASDRGKQTIETTFSPELEAHVRAASGSEETFRGLSTALSSPENLAFRAARALLGDRGFHIRLEKHVPFGAGLGGGSSDAASTLLALSVLSPEIPRETIWRAACALGSDVPATLLNRLCLLTGQGEQLYSVAESPALEEACALLVKPLVAVETARAYRLFGCARTLSPGAATVEVEGRLRDPRDLSQLGVRIHNESSVLERLTLLPQEGISDMPERGGAVTKTSSASGSCRVDDGAAPRAKPCVALPSEWYLFLENDFQAVVFREYPEVREVAEELRRTGAVHTLLCGSGSSVLGFFDDRESRDSAQSALGDLSRGWLCSPVRLVPNVACSDS